jgi:maltose O-acetyltransferase
MININLKIFLKVIKHIRAFIRIEIRSFLIKIELIFKKNVFVGRGVIIDPEYYWLISIGKNSVLTSGVTILAHDGSTSNLAGYTKVGRVSIGNDTFIGVKSIILPGVEIGDHVIIGAGSVVSKDIPSGSIAAGNPAVVIGSTSEYLRKHNENVKLRKRVYETGWRSRKGIISTMNEELKEGIGYAK